MAEIALAAGFSSIRQFNDTVRSVFALDADRAAPPGEGVRPVAPRGTLRLRLAFRGPLSPENLFGHLAATAVPGVEEVRDGTYRRTLRLPHGTGIAELTPEASHIVCRLTLEDLRDLGAAIARCRWLLDLDADPEAIDGELALRRRPRAVRRAMARAGACRAPSTAPSWRSASCSDSRSRRPRRARSRRGSQTVYGEAVADPDGGLSRLFPSPDALVDLDDRHAGRAPPHGTEPRGRTGRRRRSS